METKPTPAALFGLFPDSLNQAILEFRQQQLKEMHLEYSENIYTLPHFTISWNPDFDFRQSNALRGMLEYRDFPPVTIEVIEIKQSGNDIAIFFDVDKTKLWVREISDVSESMGMDVVYTNQIKLLKTTIISGNEATLIHELEQLIPKKIEIKTIGFGGKLLREEDLNWKISLTGDYLKVRLKL